MAFLSNRNQYINVNGKYSRQVDVTSDVIQGNFLAFFCLSYTLMASHFHVKVVLLIIIIKNNTKVCFSNKSCMHNMTNKRASKG